MPFAVAPREVRLVLDTNIINAHRKGEPSILEDIGAYLSYHPQLTTCSEVVFELRWGLEKLARKNQSDPKFNELRRQLDEYLEAFEILPFNAEAARIAAILTAELGRATARESDIRIAATAVAFGYGVATRNREDFEAIGRVLPPRLLLYLAIWRRRR